MPLSHKSGILLSSLSALNGVSKASIGALSGASLSAAWSPIVTENFNGTVGNAITSRASDSAHTWTLAGDTNGNLNVGSGNIGVLANNAPSRAVITSSATISSGAQRVKATFIVDNAGKTSMCIGCRIVDINNLYYAGFTAGYFFISQRSSGSEITMGTGWLPPGAGTYQVTFDVSDSAKILYVDGVARVTATDNTHTATGNIGFYTGFAELGIQIDSFQGGIQ